MFIVTLILYQKRPFLIVPPLCGSVLLGSSKNFKTKWYCSSKLEDEYIWLNEKYIIPPLTNCLADYMECEWNETSQQPGSKHDINIHTFDFGGDQAIRFIDKGFFGYKFGAVMAKLLDRFSEGGYTIREDMFGAPFDWRLNPVAIDSYYPMLKDLIEHAFNSNNKQKVTLYTISAGSMALHTFLTEHVSQEWKNQYILKIIIHGPSFSGAFDAFDAMWTGNLAYMPSSLESDQMKHMVKSIPTMQAHLFKSKVFEDNVFVYGPNGEKYTAKDLPNLILEHNKIPINHQKIFEYSTKYIKKDLIDPGVPTYLLYNSQINTPRTIHFLNGWDKPFTILNGKGDGTVLSDGFKYPCYKWNDSHALICHDIYIDNDKYNHANQLQNPEVLDLVFKIVQDDSWLKNGRKIIQGI